MMKQGKTSSAIPLPRAFSLLPLNPSTAPASPAPPPPRASAPRASVRNRAREPPASCRRGAAREGAAPGAARGGQRPRSGGSLLLRRPREERKGLLGLLRAPRSPGGRTALRARPPSAAPRRWRCCGGDEQLLFPPSYLRQLLLWQLLPLLLLLLLLRERLISSSLAVAPLFVLRLPPLLRPRPLFLRLRLRSFRPRLLRQPPASPRRKRRRCPKATKRKSRSRKERVVVSLQLVPPLLLLDERGDCQSERERETEGKRGNRKTERSIFVEKN